MCLRAGTRCVFPLAGPRVFPILLFHARAQSFHFSPKLPAKGWKPSEAAHEARIAATLGLKPGMKCLDCGCGVGGPLRTIASVSGAHVTGITINEYQVGRAKYHNDKVSPDYDTMEEDLTE